MNNLRNVLNEHHQIILRLFLASLFHHLLLSQVFFDKLLLSFEDRILHQQDVMPILKKEAAYRKILVIAEDDETVRPKTISELFDGVRSIHFLSYSRYLYFNIGRMAYLQANVLSAYVFLAPAIVAGVVTLGVMQQIIRAFGRVEGSMQYLLKAWPTIIELASVYKRLREFELQILQNKKNEN